MTNKQQIGPRRYFKDSDFPQDDAGRIAPGHKGHSIFCIAYKCDGTGFRIDICDCGSLAKYALEITQSHSDMEKEIERLRQALDLYADEKNWAADCDNDGNTPTTEKYVYCPNGHGYTVARQALEGEE